MTVDIALATYNGARYLKEQIESILAQDYQDWRLIVRDDASTDGTPTLLAAYEESCPGRIEVIKGDKKRLGIVGNFSAALTATSAPYVMCADQDDVWLPHKLSLTLAGMKELEALHGSDVPLLVHTDSEIVDSALQPVAESFAAFHKLKPEQSPLAKLLVQNTVQGCTMMVNRALLNLALPIPHVVRMYDMWMAQVAAGLGHIGYIEQATVQYRQHVANALGIRKKTLREKVGHIQNMMEGNVTQAILLQERIGERLKEHDQKLLKLFSKLPDYGFLKRRLILTQNAIMREPRWQNIPMLLFV